MPPTGYCTARIPQKEQKSMKTIGMISTMVFLLLAAAGTVLFIRSIPDIRRYLRMREM
jgi:hypothetical protein